MICDGVHVVDLFSGACHFEGEAKARIEQCGELFPFPCGRSLGRPLGAGARVEHDVFTRFRLKDRFGFGDGIEFFNQRRVGRASLGIEAVVLLCLARECYSLADEAATVIALQIDQVGELAATDFFYQPEDTQS